MVSQVDYKRDADMLNETAHDLSAAKPSIEAAQGMAYAMIDGRRQLVGVAYTLYRRPTDPMPEGFAGDSDHWHVHDVTKIAQAVTEDRPFVRWLVNSRIRRGKVGAGDRAH